MRKLTFGITTFLESGVDKDSGMISHDQRINHAIEEIVLADQVGLNYYGIGEHHRIDYAASNPEIILAAASKLTKNIHLGSAVTVLSSEDPVRVYESFATLDILSDGRAEIMAGRGSFIESFPLFGYDLKDYDRLFTDKLNMLLEIRKNEKVFWSGTEHTQRLDGLSIYPRSIQKPLKVSIAVGGTPNSVIRAGKLGLPIVFAIIGGEPIRFKPLIDLYKYHYQEAGHDINKMEIGVHSHGIITDGDEKEFKDRYFKSHQASFSKIGEERGWSRVSKERFLASIEYGPLYVGNVDFVAKKIAKTIKELGINRFLLHTPGSYMPHEDVMKSIKLYGLEVVPKVKDLLEK